MEAETEVWLAMACGVMVVLASVIVGVACCMLSSRIAADEESDGDGDCTLA